MPAQTNAMSSDIIPTSLMKSLIFLKNKAGSLKMVVGIKTKNRLTTMMFAFA